MEPAKTQNSMPPDRINKLKDFLRESPGDAFLQHALALEFMKAGDDDSAQKLFEDILEQHPTYIGSYYHLGKLLLRKEDRSGAMNVYERELNRQPGPATNMLFGIAGREG